jgi:hypothetical protein
VIADSYFTPPQFKIQTETEGIVQVLSRLVRLAKPNHYFPTSNWNLRLIGGC